MPADRVERLEERVEALTEILVAEGLVSREWADAVESTEQIGEGREVAQAAREGRGPPESPGRGGRNE